jgi:hypothetical protein
LLLAGVLACVVLLVPAVARADFGVVPGSFQASATNAAGEPDVQAGSHPFALTTSIDFNQKTNYLGEETGDGSPKDIFAAQPVGLTGDVLATPRCTQEAFFHYRGPGLRTLCPNDTAVGEISLTTTTGFTAKNPPQTFRFPIYNLVPRPGAAAEFGFIVILVPVRMSFSVRTGGDYGLTANLNDLSQSFSLKSTKLTIWGVPGDPAHDPYRGDCLQYGSPQGVCLSDIPPHALLSLPGSCGTPLVTGLSLDSWANPGVLLDGEAVAPALEGCEHLDFSPSMTVTPESRVAGAPTGISVHMHVPQNEDPNGLAEAVPKKVVVSLPAGMSVNPAAAGGLGACTPAEIGLDNADAPSCPNSSKVGTIEIDTVALEHPVVGSVYVAQQTNNPFGSLVALYIAAEDPVSGVRVKTAGQVALDPVTGQLTTTFDNTPEQPFSDFKLNFFGGPRAALVNPSTCGSYTASGELTPYSSQTPTAVSSTFVVDQGCGAHAFNPSFTAGTINNQAGAFAPFALSISRQDGEGMLGGVTTTLPAGLSGMLSKVPLCGEAQANTGDCSAASEIGHLTASAGVGSEPAVLPAVGEPVDPVYLTGPYKGAPFGLAFVVAAQAGPFNLGRVVVRARVLVDPHTARVTVVSDPLPTILQGIPLNVRGVDVTIDRPEFTFNPTSCEPMSVAGTVSSVQGATANVSSRFQAANCAALAFKPKFSVSTSGKTSRANGASLDVKLSYPNAPLGTQANIARVKVDLPKQLPSRLTTLQKACTAAQFETNPAGCPATSLIGHATVHTPLLAGALSGPAIFVSHGGEAFPSLIIVLQGEGVTLNLVGTTFISKTGITSSTFKTVPDAPVGSFELTLPEGKYSALAANGNLCTSTLAMPTELVAQNGLKINESTPIAVTGCKKVKLLTRAQKLKATLKACRKDHNKAKRTKCEKTASRAYGAVKKAKKK